LTTETVALALIVKLTDGFETLRQMAKSSLSSSFAVPQRRLLRLFLQLLWDLNAM
jgi:hypothetical protein